MKTLAYALQVLGLLSAVFAWVVLVPVVDLIDPRSRDRN
jgi:hypothetical protein